MLTVLEVKAAKPKDKPYKLTDGKGLFLHVSTSGKKTWRYRYEVAGTESTYVLGEYPVVSLEHARLERIKLREMVKAGINPTTNRRQEKEAVILEQEKAKESKENSFESIAFEWHKQQSNRWTKDHADAVINTLRQNAFPSIGNLPVDQITPPMVLKILRAIESRNALEIAAKTLQRISAVFRYAVQSGRATYNPAADMRGVLKPKRVQHHPMISVNELPQFLHDMTNGDIHIITKLAMQFTILTAARSGEVRGATWDEINFENRVWSIPGPRMKMRLPHVVPLSKQAFAILQRAKILSDGSHHIFPGRNEDKPISENTMLFALYRIGYHSKATMHGFRALFSTITNEKGFNPDAIERQLAHREKNTVRAAYHRSEYLLEREKMMQWWADHLQELEFENK